MRPFGNSRIKKMLRRPTEHELKCLCGARMRLRFSTRFKGGSWYYVCDTFPRCTVTHGCHQATGEPLGRPADQETRTARTEAHDALDQLWRVHGWNRQEAYEWMRKTLNLTPEENHIGMMDVESCRRVVEEVKKLLEGL